VEILNPAIPRDLAALQTAVAEATEIATALPSVSFYDRGDPAGTVARILGAGFAEKARRTELPRAVVYAAENHNHAAEILEEAVRRTLGPNGASPADRVQYLNTVIGKMSGVVTDPAQIREQRLEPITPDLGRCFLVEQFNRILISRIRWPDFVRGISVFEEKPDLLPFEEAKLFGHNATHALLGYLAHRRGYRHVAEAEADRPLMRLVRDAFLKESGAPLAKRHAGVDPLFTESGYRDYADDLLRRMLNPHLRDSVDRVIRDPRRKLGWEDRLVGTMRLALEYGVEPRRYALGAAAALRVVQETEGGTAEQILHELWKVHGAQEAGKRRVADLILTAAANLDRPIS
jgi:mannitol-1-phosphate 5-dehydrogenase